MDDVELSARSEAASVAGTGIGSEAASVAGTGIGSEAASVAGTGIASEVTSPENEQMPAHATRGIGRWGTVARAVIGSALVVDVFIGHATGDWHLMPWLLALVVFPAVLLIGQRVRSRFDASRLDATSPAWHVVNVVVFLALYLTPVYAPALEATSDAALVFYGASMLLAAARGYAGCEVLTVSNSLLRRDDQVGCLLFAPVDHLEGRLGGSGPGADV